MKEINDIVKEYGEEFFTNDFLLSGDETWDLEALAWFDEKYPELSDDYSKSAVPRPWNSTEPSRKKSRMLHPLLSLRVSHFTNCWKRLFRNSRNTILQRQKGSS